MKKLFLILLIGCCAALAVAQNSDTIKKRIDGTAVLSTGDILTNITQIKQLARFSQLIHDAGLDSLLRTAGPLTIFAPNQAAFSHSGIDVADSLTKPANKPILTRLLLNHIVKGNVSVADIKKQIDENSGSATLTMLDGGKITATINADRNIVLTDETNKASIISRFDIPASNGRIHILNSVLLPGN